VIARDIALQLDELGYEALGPACTGEQAIAMAGEMRPDLILMDVHLGSAIDGIDAALAIRAQFGLPTVYLSAFTDGGNLERAKRSEPVGYLAKPFLEYQLRDVIAAAFHGP
jgi:two-component system cell cycle sensor histidine kinase/response regulator CckA